MWLAIMNSNFTIPSICYKSYSRYEHEILLEVNQSLIDSKNDTVRKNTLHIKPSFLYQDLKFHQEMMKNFFYYNEINLLKKYIKWRYRVYFHRQIELDYLLYEYEIWKMITKKFIDPLCLISINAVYDWLIKNHHQFLQEGLQEKLFLDTPLDEELYHYAVCGDFDSFYTLAKTHCTTLSSFCDFFSTHITNITQYVGYEWEINKLSVAKEHLSSNIIEKTAFHLLEQFPIEKKKKGTILIAGAKDEYHFLGGKIAIAILERMGLTVINLGANTPKKELLSIYSEFYCDCIILVASLPTNLELISETIKEIKKYDSEEQTQIIISGNAFSSLQNPMKTFGTELYFKNYTQMYQFFIQKSF